MKQKIYFCLLFVVCFVIDGYGQILNVKGMKVNKNDISGSTKERKDNKGIPCALIKVLLPASGIQFEGNIVGNVENRIGEYWVYMADGSQVLQLMTAGNVLSRIRFADYGIQRVKSKITYALTIDKAVSQSQPTSVADCRMLADDYYFGNGVNVQNYAEAAKWYHKAAEQGDLYAQYNLGIMYENGQGVATDFFEAVKWYRKAAQGGMSMAQYNLGSSYYQGKGILQDYSEAAKWFLKAAEQGEVSAMHNLGVMYEDGEGVKKSIKEAMKWYEKAGEAGHVGAQFNLGAIYLEGGAGVKRDMKKALIWMCKAAAQGDEEAQSIARKMGWQW